MAPKVSKGVCSSPGLLVSLGRHAVQLADLARAPIWAPRVPQRRWRVAGLTDVVAFDVLHSVRR